MKLKKLLILLVIAFALIQFKQIDRTQPEADPELDYMVQTNAPPEVEDLIKKACYDCHSNEVNFPWYTYVAPFSWSIEKHVKEGRKHLNFSEWGNYSLRRKKGQQKESAEEIKTSEMPTRWYIWVHSEAKLSDVEKETLIDWFSKQSDLILE